MQNTKEYDNEEKETQQSKIEAQKKLIYDKTVTCPICQNTFKAKAVKTSAYRVQKKDPDFFIRYLRINPYFYDVWVCNDCGYSLIKSDFPKIRKYQIDAIKEKITPKWHSRTYPDVYNVDTAIERYKLSLINYHAMDAKASQKAMNTLKLAWMYRILDDKKNESNFLKQTLENFNYSYSNENFPICGMDQYTFEYLLGELNMKLKNTDEALKWFGNVITGIGTPYKIKDMAISQKDIINKMLNPKKDNISTDTQKNHNSNNKGFLSNLFK
ncbi:DUF2225 domain-containing protein [Clostridium fermenticellae]|uniref:DUF2225 domain-containing protein n=1 Tax=Clostridium fermenticellae TaxID=2068654 RepID=UPI003C12BF07